MKAPARPPSTRRKHRWTALVAIGAVVLLSGGIAGVYLWTLSSALDVKTEKIHDAFPADDTLRPPAVESAAQNILLLGSDTRGKNTGSLANLAGQRSDTIMVAHIPADRKHIYVMSILRDSWLEIPGHGQAKINAALSYGGVPLAVETIEGMLGSRIDHVAIVDFSGFKGITEALGGVDLTSQLAFTAQGYQFSRGRQHVDGTQALAFVRERYAFRDGDFQRVRNQQSLMRAVLTKMLTAETLTNPGQISGLVGNLAPFLAVDEGLSAAYVAGLGVELRGLRTGDITFFTMPTLGTGTSPNGQSIVNVDWEKLKTVREAFRSDNLDAYAPEVQTIG